MALLKDTLIQGSARVTDTLYSNKININNILTVKKLVISSTTAEEHIQFSRTDNINYILFPNSANTGVAIGYGVGTAYCPLIIQKTSIYPGGTTSTISLGATNNRWNGVYSSTGNFSGTVTVDRLSTNIFLDFRCSDGPSYIMLPDSKDLIINNGSTNGTAYANLQIGKTGITNAYGGHLGSSTYYWGNIYARGYIYMKGTNQYPLDFFIYNKHGNQVAEMWYDCGATETVTGGAWRFRQFSPAATPAATTSGFKETYRLPTVTNGLTADKNYDILTTKNTITVAQGGTGAATFTADCAIVGNGTSAMASRGLKITGATDGNVTIQPYTSGKDLDIYTNNSQLTIQGGGNSGHVQINSQDIEITNLTSTGQVTLNSAGTMTATSAGIMTISVGNTLYINKPTNASIIFTSGGADTSHESGRFNIHGMFHLGSMGTQNTHRLYVNGNSCFNGKIAFGSQSSNVITENASIAYNSTSKTIDSKFPWNEIISGSGTAGVTYNATGPVNGVPALWKFNCGIATPTNGTTITIEIPVAGHDSGVFVSTDNGTTYRPVSVSGTSRLTTHYPVGHFVTLTFDADGTTNSLYPIAGGTTRYNSNTTQIPGAGCWRVVNYYDSGAPYGIRMYNQTSGYNGDYPLLVSRTALSTQIGTKDSNSSYSNNIYAIIWDSPNDGSHNKTPTLNPNTGLVKMKDLTLSGALSVTGNSTLSGNLTLNTTHAVYGILGAFNTTTSTDCGGLSWHEVSAVGPSTTLNVNDAPNTDWWYVLRNRHTNTTNNYYTDIALPFNSNGIYYKVIRNNAIQNTGVYNGWVKVLDEFGGIFETSSALEKYGNNTSWVNARDGAIIRRYRNLQGETTASLVNSGNYDTANGRYVAAVSLIGLYYTWSIAQYTNDTLYFDCTNNDHYNSATNQTVASISITTSGALTANKVYGAVWNDYAEYRKQLYKVEPGRVVYDLDDGYILPTDKRLQPGAQVVSDTFGFAIGETEESKTPLAVTGRVLVYTYRDRYEYHAGDAVCSAPNGTVDIMTREEIKEYPDAIIGIVSEIPHYETWGTSNVPVNGRIWIKVR